MTSPDGIPTVADYAHWNEDAAAVWWLENRYDMEHADERREEAMFDAEDRDDRYEEPFEDSFDTEAEARAFGDSLDDSPKSISQWPPGSGLWYVEHYDAAGHKRWLETP